MKRFREEVRKYLVYNTFSIFNNLNFQSGAKINISDGTCPERIVTVTGNTESIFKAFTLICNKFDEVKGPELALRVHRV